LTARAARRDAARVTRMKPRTLAALALATAWWIVRRTNLSAG